jgi:hypothetical protein
MTSARLSFDKSRVGSHVPSFMLYRVGGRVPSFMLYYEFIGDIK